MDYYQQRALEGASGVELTIALYDGIVRFVREAIAAVNRGDVPGRRRALKRAMDIVIHLQGTLRLDIGGKPAEALLEFYTSIFALMLQGSMEASPEKLEKAIDYVLNVRDAWRQVVHESRGMATQPPTQDEIAMQQGSGYRPSVLDSMHEAAARWTA